MQCVWNNGEIKTCSKIYEHIMLQNNKKLLVYGND